MIDDPRAEEQRLLREETEKSEAEVEANRAKRLMQKQIEATPPSTPVKKDRPKDPEKRSPWEDF